VSTPRGSLCDPGQVAFSLITDIAGSSETFTDDDTYRFTEHGLLQIDRLDGTRRLYSPGAWQYVEERRDPSRSRFTGQ